MSPLVSKSPRHSNGPPEQRPRVTTNIAWFLASISHWPYAPSWDHAICRQRAAVPFPEWALTPYPDLRHPPSKISILGLHEYYYTCFRLHLSLSVRHVGHLARYFSVNDTCCCDHSGGDSVCPLQRGRLHASARYCLNCMTRYSYKSHARPWLHRQQRRLTDGASFAILCSRADLLTWHSSCRA